MVDGTGDGVMAGMMADDGTLVGTKLSGITTTPG
jgi:hypothetical protein